MRRLFAEVWESLEARRRQVESGEVSPPGCVERIGQEGRRASGCPTEEALCGWVDGWLRRKHPRRWLQVWRHIQLQGCPACRQNVATLQALLRPSRQPHARARTWRAQQGSAPMRSHTSWLRATTPLAWASWALVAVLGLALWSIVERDTTPSLRARAQEVLIGERRQVSLPRAPLPRIKLITNDPAGNLLLWGD
jgi:hypothetical protein